MEFELSEVQRTKDCVRALGLFQSHASVEERVEVLQVICDMIKIQKLDLKFYQAGACERLVEWLEESPDTPVLLVGLFRVIGWLCFSNSQTRQRLGELGCCEQVVRALQENHAGSKNLADYGCFAISSLCNNSHENKTKLRHAHAREVVRLCPTSDLKASALQRLG
ncbi:hypothetical protein BASA81_005852 [Batrachochytrium salamandrivorans]|nr:hypothetical protein BASA81_005852 [Batrachochytrium salamandrivorans]